MKKNIILMIIALMLLQIALPIFSVVIETEITSESIAAETLTNRRI